MHERTLIGRDGRRIPVEINTRMVPFEGRDMVVSIIHDISERRRIEEERAHLAAIVQYSNDAIVAETLDGIITGWNRGAVDLFGYEADEVIGKSVGMLFPPGCLDAELTMCETLKQGMALRDYDTVRVRKDGSSIPVSITISPICDRTGSVVGISKIARDITAKKRAEEALGKAKATAEEANRAKSTFLSNMSHEIRTPLHNIILLAELLRRDAIDPLQQQRLERLCATADHMLSIINDILELSRIEAVRLTLDNRDFLLATVLDSVVAVIREPARAKGLDVVVEVPPSVRDASLRGDRVRLEQVLINLASNAVKFTEHGAIAISVECLASEAHSVKLRFAVKDTGIGIAPEDRDRIFEAFEQVDASSRRTLSGSGLGLAICDRLVRAMGGAIDVTSAPGAGSTFGFDLTFARGSGVADEADEGAAAGDNFSGSHVLIVEDNSLSRDLLGEMVADLGCAVDPAADGVEAVEKARENVYDLILMDVQMPRLDGLGATRAIRALPEHQHTPIVAITASAFVEDRKRCYDAGMNGYLRKPVTRAALAAELGNWLAGSADPAAGGARTQGGTHQTGAGRGHGQGRDARGPYCGSTHARCRGPRIRSAASERHRTTARASRKGTVRRRAAAAAHAGRRRRDDRRSRRGTGSRRALRGLAQRCRSASGMTHWRGPATPSSNGSPNRCRPLEEPLPRLPVSRSSGVSGRHGRAPPVSGARRVTVRRFRAKPAARLTGAEPNRASVHWQSHGSSPLSSRINCVTTIGLAWCT